LSRSRPPPLGRPAETAAPSAPAAKSLQTRAPSDYPQQPLPLALIDLTNL